MLVDINCAKKAVRSHLDSRHSEIFATGSAVYMHLSRWIKSSRTRQSAKYLGDRVLARTIDNVVHRPLATDVIHTDELEKTRVDEAHAHAIPHVHGSQVRNDGQRSPEAIRRGEKVEHRCYTWNTMENAFSIPSVPTIVYLLWFECIWYLFFFLIWDVTKT